MTDLIRARHHGGALVPVGQTLRLDEGETVFITVERLRSDATHRHEVAWLRDAWGSLPDALRGEPYAKSPEHLRKYALIQCGFADCRDVVVEDELTARRVAAFIRPITDEYALVAVSGNVVRVYTAQSQSRRAMGSKRFQESKTAIMDWIAGLLEVSREQLEQ